MGEFDVATQRRTKKTKLTVLPAAEVPALCRRGRTGPMLARMERRGARWQKKGDDGKDRRSDPRG